MSSILLEKGTTLVEASAGTGKTYTLCRIALKLTLEKGITLDRILAVTFTEAATEELASRIQNLYQSVLKELESGKPEEAVLLECMGADDFDEAKAKRDLRFSLEVFDEAPISTLHGFCKRSLDQLALETQAPFDAELGQVENQLIERLQSEYIRQNILEVSTALSTAYNNQSNFEKRLSEVGRQTASHPEASLYPPPQQFSLEDLERSFAEIPAALEQLLLRKADYLKHLKINMEPGKQVGGKKPQLAACGKRGSILSSDFVWLEKFREEAWLKAMKKSGSGLEIPPFVILVDRVLSQIDAAYSSLVYNYKSWLSENLEKAKQQANSISFNDLLHQLNRSLKGETGERVKSVLSSQYDAALIDEFQDTDRTQLDIITSLFGDGEHYLFYIGDPKQAIYRFRGADINAYFQAVGAAETRKHELTENFRSMPKLIHAVNTIFEASPIKFLNENIKFVPVRSGRGDDDEITCSSKVPFRIEQLLLSDSAKPAAESQYRKIITERVANDFAERINKEPDFSPADVAFLVNSNSEAMALSDALMNRGITSSVRSDRSVFSGKEALDLRQLLAALINPTRVSLKRGAYSVLCKSVMAEEVASSEFDLIATPFYEYLGSWSKDWYSLNFDVCLQEALKLAAQDDVGDLDTERRHANLCQLGELLSEARDESDLSPRGLYNWLCRKMDEDTSQNKDWQTRISSDEGKPQILTVHKSKGLQFPVVILPYLSFKRVKPDAVAISYHNSEDNLIIDYAPDPNSEGAARAGIEELSEHIRLLYVSLTRAERETMIYLAPEEISKQGKRPRSSFARFVLGDADDISSTQLLNTLQAIASDSDGCIQHNKRPLEIGEFVKTNKGSVSTDTAEAKNRGLENRKHMPYPERVLSFSALNKALHRDDNSFSVIDEETETADSDEPTEVLEVFDKEEEADEALTIFSLPKGTHAGDLLHLILERFDFSRPETLAKTTQDAFESLNFEPRDFEPIVAAQVGEIAKLQLPSLYGAFSLNEIAKEKRIPELEFSYPVSGDVKAGIIEALNSTNLGLIPTAWVRGLSQETGSLSSSMLRGFIDLVVEHKGRLYIFDWKSNYLGPSPSDYNHEAILESMSDHNYFLQYLLYCVALKRYVKWRFPTTPFTDVFGGVFYLYARGISPGKETGIFYDCPTEDLIEQLDRALYAGSSIA